MSIKPHYFRYLEHFGKTVPVREIAEHPDLKDAIALRHDVDYDIDTALELSFWEKEHGCRSTYFLLHSATYWNDPLLLQKALQIQDFGHEVGLHVNFFTLWLNGLIDDIEKAMKAELAMLRNGGIDLVGVSPHGDNACYKHQFINYWYFLELRPEKPEFYENGRNAEGISETEHQKRISYPSSHVIVRDGNGSFPLWSLSMKDHGILYDAIHICQDTYFTDSGGKWKRSADPLDENLSHGRYQVLIHPEYWQGSKKAYFFMSTARSGSKWLANLLDTASSLKCNHEFSLNHRYIDGELKFEKRTNHGLIDFLKNEKLIRELLIESRDYIENLPCDYGETNVYLERVFPIMKEVFPDAMFIHLHRDPRDVVRSILNRGWYDTPGDSKHPEMEVYGWPNFSQFEKACYYVFITNENLFNICKNRIIFEKMVTDLSYLSNTLKSFGIAVYPRMALVEFGKVINENVNTGFSSYADWPVENKIIFNGILWPAIIECGYYPNGDENEYLNSLGCILKKYLE